MRKLKSIQTGLSCGGGSGDGGDTRAPSPPSDEVGGALGAIFGAGEGMTGGLVCVALIGGGDELSSGGFLFSSFRAFARLCLINEVIVQLEALLVIDAGLSN